MASFCVKIEAGLFEAKTQFSHSLRGVSVLSGWFLTAGLPGLSPLRQKLPRTFPVPGPEAAGCLRVCSTAPWWSCLGRGPVSLLIGLYPAPSEHEAPGP